MEQLLSLLRCGTVNVVTDKGEIGLCHTPQSAGEYESDAVHINVGVYEKGGEVAYRDVTVICKEDITLFRIELTFTLDDIPTEFISYRTFVDAPAAAFIRYEHDGLFTGAENPFFTVTQEGKEIRVSYEPSLLLKAGETYRSDPQFLGHYLPSGKKKVERYPVTASTLYKGIQRPRFFNPCGAEALDENEIEAMRRYVREYYDVMQRSFDNILYCFFYPGKKLPQTEADADEYLGMIDRFDELSGDIIAFNPQTEISVPTEERPYWEMAPQGSYAEKILHYAQQKGIRCGYYMGCGIPGPIGRGGNAALLPFCPEKSEWKKRDRFGNTSQENCLGCDGYLDWWYTVQKNTIEKYDLGYWSWDPGPGNGNDCYAENHGHIPGRGEYKGWRNSQELLRRIRETFPQLFLMSFYGRKEYGLWGFRYISQHEVFWEQTLTVDASLHNDTDDDRLNAHGVRLQNQWCMDFRFLPAHLGHGLVTRMGSFMNETSLDQAYDFAGWRYSLLSAIACCGSVTLCSMPDKLENVPGMREFYHKWINWAKENNEYTAYTRPLADSVSNDVIDGYARIIRDRGQIFLFNSSPKVLHKSLKLDASLGLDTSKEFYLRILYSDSLRDHTDKCYTYGKKYAQNDVLEVTLPAYDVLVLEISDEPGEMLKQIPHNIHTIDNFTTEDGVPFAYPQHKEYDRITLCSKAFFPSALRDELAGFHTTEEDTVAARLPQWRRDQISFTFTGAFQSRLMMYIPFNKLKHPRDVKLYINGQEVASEEFGLHAVTVLGEVSPYPIPVSRFAYIENYIRWDRENDIRLQISGLAENSFMGLFVDYPRVADGMIAEETVFPERKLPPERYSDPSLRINSFTVTPDAYHSTGDHITLCVQTDVPPEMIESVYCVHPTIAVMPSLNYDAEKKVWQANFVTSERCLSIFCNSDISAWIQAKDGGVGPRAYLHLNILYAP